MGQSVNELEESTVNKYNDQINKTHTNNLDWLNMNDIF